MVKWSKPAKRDLKKIHDYIKQDSINYAKKVVNDILEKSDILNNFPKLGRTVPEISRESIREIFIYSYRIIYEIIDNDIYILAIIHFKQDFSSDQFEKIN